jgi:hypothetical protein
MRLLQLLIASRRLMLTGGPPATRFRLLDASYRKESYCVCDVIGAWTSARRRHAMRYRGLA